MLQLDMFKHDFPWGTCVKADMISGEEESDIKYQETFYENFEYAVLENALKWRPMEWQRASVVN